MAKVQAVKIISFFAATTFGNLIIQFLSLASAFLLSNLSQHAEVGISMAIRSELKYLPMICILYFGSFLVLSQFFKINKYFPGYVDLAILTRLIVIYFVPPIIVVLYLQNFTLANYKFFTISLGFLIVCQLYLRVYHLLHTKDKLTLAQPVAIYGAGVAGIQLLNSLSNGSKFKISFFLDDEPKFRDMLVSGFPVYSFDEAEKFNLFEKIKVVLLAIPSLDPTEKQKILEKLSAFAIQAKTLPSVHELVEDRIESSDLRPVSISEILGREQVDFPKDLMSNFLKTKTVLVSGGGGSIGSEICRTLICQGVKKLIVVEQSEYLLYKLQDDLNLLKEKNNLSSTFKLFLGSAHDTSFVQKVFNKNSVDIVFHAAAYKHVPLIEDNEVEGCKNNVFSTEVMLNLAIRNKVESFILISTDKAVRATNVMGASKRLSELICLYKSKNRSIKTKISIVRFGNVLGSSGSVIPKFEKQIIMGGPVVVTHKDIERFFMSIPEAATLVVQASSVSKGGDIFVLDMGKPVKIIDLAKKMIRLSGHIPFEKDKNETGDVEVLVSGLRKGEKLFEELTFDGKVNRTAISGILVATENETDHLDLAKILNEVKVAIQKNDSQGLRGILKRTAMD